MSIAIQQDNSIQSNFTFITTGTYDPLITSNLLYTTSNILQTNINTKQDILTASTSLLGNGAAITNLAYANINGKPTNFQADWTSTIINKPPTFPADMTTIYTKTETNNLLNAKQATLTASTTLIGIGSNLTNLDYLNIKNPPTLNFLQLTGGTVSGNITTQQLYINNTSGSTSSIFFNPTASIYALFSRKPPWAMYFAEDYNTLTKILPNYISNGRDATITGNGTVAKTTAAGNGATGAITYISGATDTTIEFAAGSIPQQFTILGLTRYNGGTRRRILQASGANWLHGHWGGQRGAVAYNDGWKFTGYTTDLDNWICTIGKNVGATPGNIVIDGVASGIAGGGAGTLRLGVNYGNFAAESSDWALSCVMIWSEGLTDAEMIDLNTMINDYKTSGTSIKTLLDTINDDECVIESRVYSGTEKTELLLFKGNDATGTNGADRIRLRAGNIAFDTYSSVTTNRNLENIVMLINENGNVGIGTTTILTNKLNVNGTISATSFLGVGTAISDLDYNKITINPLIFNNPIFEDANNIISIDLDNNTINQYPNIPMISSSLLIKTQSFGNGAYTVSASSNSANAYNLFTSTTTTAIIVSAATAYRLTTPFDYISATASTIVSSVAIAGEWIQMQYDKGFVIKKINLYGVSSSTNCPGSFILAGSLDGSNWTLLLSQTGITTYITSTANSFIVSNQISYNYYRIIVTNLNGVGQQLNIASIQLFGTGNTSYMNTDIFNAIIYNTNEKQFPPRLYDTTLSEVLLTTAEISCSPSLCYKQTITLNNHGSYTIYSSTIWDASHQKNLLFNYNLSDSEGAHWASGQYASISSTFVGNYIANNYINIDYKGDWIIIKFPLKIIITRFRFYNRTGPNTSRAPGLWKCYGSNDGITFTEITEASNFINSITTVNYSSGYYEKQINTTFNIPYLYIGWTINKLVGGDVGATILNFMEIQIFGKDDISNSYFNGSNILQGIINTSNINSSNYTNSTSNILQGIINTSNINSSNYTNSTSNILQGIINTSNINSSNYTKSTSNILQGIINTSNINSSNYTKSTSNILQGIINTSNINSSNYTNSTSNILQGIMNTSNFNSSNYTTSTSNILQGIINTSNINSSNYTNSTSNILQGIINTSNINSSNYTTSTSNILQGIINTSNINSSNYTKYASNILQGIIITSNINSSNYTNSTSNILQGIINTKQATLTAATTLLGIGSNITALDYNKITINPLIFNNPISEDANNIISINFDNTTINQYPNISMISSSLLLTTQSFGNGTYTASASSNSANAYSLFTSTTTTAIIVSAATAYRSTTPFDYTAATASTIVSSVAIAGEWIQMQYDKGFVIKKLNLYGVTSSNKSPGSFILAGSLNGTNWTLLLSQTGITTYTTSTANSFIVSNQTSYNYYRIIVTNLNGVGQQLNIASIQLFGTGNTSYMNTDNFNTIIYNTNEKQFPPRLYDTASSEVLLTTAEISCTPSLCYKQTITLNNHGSYTIYSSSTYGVSYKNLLFDYDLTDYVSAHWAANQYASAGNYIANNYINIDYKGDWIIIKLPYKIVLTRFRFYSRSAFTSRAPGLWKCYGSNDGIIFTEITEASNSLISMTVANYAFGYCEMQVNATFDIPYLYIGWTINKLVGGAATAYILNFNELQVFGKDDICNSYSKIWTNSSNNNITFNNPTTLITYTSTQSIDLTNKYVIFNYTEELYFNSGTYTITFALGAITINTTPSTNLYSYPILKDSNLNTINPIIWYKFDSGAFLDDNGSYYNGSLTTSASAPTIDTSIGNYYRGVSSAAFAAASSQYFSVPTTIDLNAINIATGISFSLWVKINTTGNGKYGRIFDFGQLSGSPVSGINYIIITRENYSNHLTFAIHNNTAGTNTAITINDLLDNSWRHIVWTISNTGVWIIYINSSRTDPSKTAIIPSIALANRTYYLGKSLFDGDGYLNMNLDDFRIYNKVLLQDEVTELYKGRVGVYKKSNFGIGTTNPISLLDVNGPTNITGNVSIGTSDNSYNALSIKGRVNIYNNNPYAATASQNWMNLGSLTIGDYSANYGGGTNPNNITNVAGLLMECSNNTEIAVHDGGTRVASFMYYEGTGNSITIGRNMGWGAITNVIIGTLLINGGITPITIETNLPDANNCIRFKNDVSKYSYIGHAGSSFSGNYANNLFIEAESAIVFNTLNKTTSSVPTMMLSTDGNIGIGTSNVVNILQVGDGGKLKISNNINDYTIIGTTDGIDGPTNTRIIINGSTRSGGNAGIINYVATSTGSHVFYTTNSTIEKMRLTSGGNLGIGITIPFAPLTIGTPEIDGSDGSLVIAKKNAGTTGTNFKFGFDTSLNFIMGTYGSTTINANNTQISQIKIEMGSYTNSLILKSTGNVDIVSDVSTSDTQRYCTIGGLRLGGWDTVNTIYNNTNTLGISALNNIIFNTGTTQGNIATKMIINTEGNIGINTSIPKCKLDINGVVNIHDGNRWAVTKANAMTGGSLIIGSTTSNYGGKTGGLESSNIACLLMECLDTTEIAVHDNVNKIVSLMYYNANTITIGRNMGENTISKVYFSSNIQVYGTIETLNLKINGTNISDIYLSSNLLPNIQKKQSFNVVCSTLITLNGNNYYKYDIDLTKYTIISNTLRIFRINCFIASGYFDLLNNNLPRVCNYDIYMANKGSAGGSGEISGINICATGVPDNYNLNKIPLSSIFLLRTDNFNYISVVSTIQNTSVNCIINDNLN
jgi:hypothetical protein